MSAKPESAKPTAAQEQAQAPRERKKVSFDDVNKVVESNSKYIKMKSGQTLILKFDKEKMFEVEREYEGKKSKGIEYDVVDINSTEEKSITFSPSWSMNLNELLKEGFTIIKVTRTGENLDTNYTFVPVNEKK